MIALKIGIHNQMNNIHNICNQGKKLRHNGSKFVLNCSKDWGRKDWTKE